VVGRLARFQAETVSIGSYVHSDGKQAALVKWTAP
jgi:hypothetical protein